MMLAAVLEDRIHLRFHRSYSARVLEDSMPPTIKQRWVIHDDGLKHPWMPDQVEEVNGHAFVCISKWDRGFVRYVSSKPLYLHKKKKHLTGSANAAFFDQLLVKRQQACDRALAVNLQDEDDAEACSIDKAPKRKKCKAGDKDALLAPAYVSIPLDRFFDEDGEVGPIVLLVLFKDLRKKCIWVEITEHGLDYIKRSINKDLQEGSMGKEYMRSSTETEGPHSISP
jgi:hypothetical protein